MRALLLTAITGTLLMGCTSPAERMADCQAQGVSRDTCYMAEQNRRNAMNQMAEEQAMRNARDAARKSP